MNNHMIKNNSMIKTINQKNTLLNKDFKIRFKNHKMIKQTLKLRILLYNNQIPKEEKKGEIEGGKSSKKIKEITKIMMNLILMEILKIKEIIQLPSCDRILQYLLVLRKNIWFKIYCSIIMLFLHHFYDIC